MNDRFCDDLNCALQSYLQLYEGLEDIVCTACYATTKDRDQVQRRRLQWQQLPELLGIIADGWPS